MTTNGSDGGGAAREVATFGGGCFWCLEPIFEEMRGVERVIPGYAGGHVPNPSYRAVCTGATGHAEVVQVTFDPGQVSLEEILRVFLTVHNPTTPNRQGADVGTQYRSAIYYHSPEQKRAAEKVIAEIGAAGVWPNRIVTEVAPLDVFYPAEEYHHDYYARNPEQMYCQIVIAPKVAKFQQTYQAALKR